jgi:uncharacterized protein (TIGR02246 family)
MKRLVGSLVIAVVVLTAFRAFAGAREEVAAADQRVIKAINERNADAAAASFAEDGVLIAARYPFRIDGREAIRAFFAATFQAFPTVRLVTRQSDIRVYGDNVAVLAAYYTFTGIDSGGKAAAVHARAGLTFVKISGQWLIVMDHGSMLPQ